MRKINELHLKQICLWKHQEEVRMSKGSSNEFNDVL